MRLEPWSYEGSRAVLIGVSAYEDAELPAIPAARNSVEAMRSLLSDISLCGWPADQITVLTNPVNRIVIEDTLAEAAENTTGVLLIYYVGHGILTSRARLCLTSSSTSSKRPQVNGLPWENAAELLDASNCPARVRLVILDCCFAGRAIEALAGDAETAVADLTHVEGVYTLTATTRNRPAHVPPLSQQEKSCTSFTGELCELIRQGIEDRPKWLALGDLYPVLRQRLKSKGLPVPSQRGTNTAGEYPFAINVAYREGRNGTRDATLEPTEANQKGDPSSPAASLVLDTQKQAAATLVDKALRTAYAVLDDVDRSQALAEIARLLSSVDQERAAKLISEAQTTCLRITNNALSLCTCLSVAREMAAIDPARARKLLDNVERLATAFPISGLKVIHPIEIALAIAEGDPDRSRSIERTIEQDNWFARARAGFAVLLNSYKTKEAITVESQKAPQAWALAEIADAVDYIGPSRAARIVVDISDHALHAWLLIKVAQALSNHDADETARLFGEAERLVRAMTGNRSDDWIRAELARALADIDCDRAENIANSISEDGLRIWALLGVSRKVARTDNRKAAAQLNGQVASLAQNVVGERTLSAALVEIARLLAEVEQEQSDCFVPVVSADTWRGRTQAAIANLLAPIDLSRSERITERIEDEACRARAQAGISRALVSTDFDRAQELALSITDHAWRARALAHIAAYRFE